MTEQVAHPQTVTTRIQMRGTGKPGHCTVKTLPDGRVRCSLRVTGTNVVQVRVGELLAVMQWLNSKAERLED